MDEQKPVTVDAKDLGEMVSKNKTLFWRALILFLLMPFITMSGCTALITFTVTQLESGFFATALPADATITAKRTESYIESVASPSNPGQRTNVTRYQDVMTVAFATDKGRQTTTKFSHNTPSVYETGDALKIYYDPENPQTIRLAAARKTPEILNIVWKITGAVFLVGVLILISLLRFSPARQRAVN